MGSSFFLYLFEVCRCCSCLFVEPNLGFPAIFHEGIELHVSIRLSKYGVVGDDLVQVFLPVLQEEEVLRRLAEVGSDPWRRCRCLRRWAD